MWAARSVAEAFDGANLEHGNEINESNKSRLSMDFRVTLKDMFHDSENETLSANTKMVLGEYWGECK